MTVPAHTNTTTAAEVLFEHRRVAATSGNVRIECACGWVAESLTPGVRLAAHAQHQADMLAAASLLADPTTRTEELAKAWERGWRAGYGSNPLDPKPANPYRT